VQRLAARLKSGAGVSVIYRRAAGSAGEQEIPLVAVPARELASIDSPAALGRVDIVDRDYLIRVADLQFGGVPTEPATGDRIVERIQGVDCVFELAARGNMKCWRHTDETQVMYRVFTRQVQ
jgi:hypothetical protein